MPPQQTVLCSYITHVCRTSQCICPAVTHQISQSRGRIISPVNDNRTIFRTCDAVTKDVFGTSNCTWGCQSGEKGVKLRLDPCHHRLTNWRACRSCLRFLTIDWYTLSRYSPCDNHTVSVVPADASPDSASLHV